MARSLKFRIQKEEELFYTCSDNKGAGQLHAYRETDLRLLFSHIQKDVFLIMHLGYGHCLRVIKGIKVYFFISINILFQHMDKTG